MLKWLNDWIDKQIIFNPLSILWEKSLIWVWEWIVMRMSFSLRSPQPWGRLELLGGKLVLQCTSNSMFDVIPIIEGERWHCTLVRDNWSGEVELDIFPLPSL